MACLGHGLLRDGDDPLGWSLSDSITQRVEAILDRLCGGPSGSSQRTSHFCGDRILLCFRQPLLELLDPDGECRPAVADVFSRDWMRRWLWPIDGDEGHLDRVDELIDRTVGTDQHAHADAEVVSLGGEPHSERPCGEHDADYPDSFVDEYTWEVELEDWTAGRWDEPVAEVA